MNDLRHASVGEVWSLRYINDDPDPWIYLILSFDQDGVNMFVLHASGYSQSCIIYEPYEDIFRNDLLWHNLLG